MNATPDLVELERQGWIALCSDEGAEYYRVHLAGDALMAFSFGVLEREQALEAMESAPPWSSFEMRDAKVVDLGSDSAVLVYSVEAQRAGQPPYSAVISSVFTREGDDWKLAFHQQTPA